MKKIVKWGNVFWGRHCPENCFEDCPKKMFWRNVLILMQDCKSLHIAVMICVTLVNTYTHTYIQRDRQLLISYTISSAS